MAAANARLRASRLAKPLAALLISCAKTQELSHSTQEIFQAARAAAANARLRASRLVKPLAALLISCAKTTDFISIKHKLPAAQTQSAFKILL